MIKETKEVLSAYLDEVPEDKRFWSHDGEVFKSLPELAAALNKMEKGVFEYHVNNEKNDFAKWIYDVIGDIKLSKNLEDVNDKKETEKKIKARISYIRKKLRGI